MPRGRIPATCRSQGSCKGSGFTETRLCPWRCEGPSPSLVSGIAVEIHTPMEQQGLPLPALTLPITPPLRLCPWRGPLTWHEDRRLGQSLCEWLACRAAPHGHGKPVLPLSAVVIVRVHALLPILSCPHTQARCETLSKGRSGQFWRKGLGGHSKDICSPPGLSPTPPLAPFQAP